MLEIIRDYNEALKADKAIISEIQQKIRSKREKVERLEKQIEKLEKKSDDIRYGRGWVKGIVEPLAEELSKRTGLKYEIYGPFGLRCETSIFLREDMSKSITEQETRSIKLTPYTTKDGIESVKYDTGEEQGEYQIGSIGYMNGFNHVSAPIPDTIEEIEKLLVTTGSSRTQEAAKA